LGLTIYTFAEQVLKGDWPAAAVLVGWTVLGVVFWVWAGRTRRSIDAEERDIRVLGQIIQRDKE
jgi:hypothetical protein